MVMVEVLIVAQLLAQDASFQQWVDSRNPAELCQIYKDGLIPDNMLPGGRAQTPCSSGGIDDPMNYVID